MDIQSFLNSGALVWLDADGALRIESETEQALKDHARSHKRALATALQALGGSTPLRLIHPMGFFGVTTANGNVPSIVAAVIRSAGLPCATVYPQGTEPKAEPYEALRRRYVLQHFDQLYDPADLQRSVERQQREAERKAQSGQRHDVNQGPKHSQHLLPFR